MSRQVASTGQTGPSRQDPLDRLTPFGWRGALVFLFVFSLASFLLCGYFIAYWRNADMDFMVVYSALLLNDGDHRAYFDHPAYWTILSVEFWFRLLHRLGLLQEWALSTVPPDSSRFDASMTNVVRAGRIVAAMTAGACVLGFAALAKRIVADRRIATCGVVAFAMSGGVQMHLRILRSEMIAACFCVIALMLLIVAARRGTLLRPIALAIAGWLCVTGLENKVQAILLIAALPALLLPFGGSATASVAFWTSSARAWLATTAAALIAAGATAAAWPLVAAGLDPVAASAAGLHPLLLGRFGTYQFLLLAWILGSMAAFAALWRVSLPETLAAMCCLFAGASLGLLAPSLQYDARDAVIVLNPIEQMLRYAQIPQAGGHPESPFVLLLAGLLGVLRRYTFVLFSSPRPTVFLTWLVIPGIVYAWRQGTRQVAVQATILMLAAIAIDAAGVRRGLKLEYFVFTDPLIIIAGMLLLDQAKDLWAHPWTFPIGAALITLHFAVSQAEPVKIALKGGGRESVCEWSPDYLPRLPLPWCGPHASASGSEVR
ncbi:hypothetical protein UNPF46_32535 [Bradyrhizobium sp. UNPF46]|uniref:hypothetical protein n=1 Tax=Bradyrhizobium sp. UNPF46 TaxID=1141168 RepID=UPI00114F46D1|nr:hypothetical protein [Bradyrhizobium sp. UNPF46]TQF26775.1 hypothetical protein UNPF46_32535 [Bradyrhizobium sp. UNPF46]